MKNYIDIDKMLAICFLVVMGLAALHVPAAMNLGWYWLVLLAFIMTVLQLLPDEKLNQSTRNTKMNKACYIVGGLLAATLQWYIVLTWWLLAWVLMIGRLESAKNKAKQTEVK